MRLKGMQIMLRPSRETDDKRLYNRAFKTGVGMSILLFVGLNVVSFLVASNEHQNYLSQEIKFAPVGRLRWGFPFIWDDYVYGFLEGGTVLNSLVASLFAFVLGFLFRAFNWKV